MDSVAFFLLTFLMTLYASKADLVNETKMPNIILFLADDLGYGDLGCYGNDTVHTPNIDRLAKEGVRLLRMYSHATCTPSRASLLTGRLPVRQGLMKGNILAFDVLMSASSDAGLPHEETTIAEVLRFHGYTTAMFGKWHLGFGQGRRFLPTNHGFGFFLGTLFSHGRPCSGEYIGILNPGLFYTFLKSFQRIWAGVMLLLITLWLTGLSSAKSTIALLTGELCLCMVLYIGLYKLTFLNPNACILLRNQEIIEQPYTYENLTLKYTQETLRVINQSVDAGKPCFVYMAYNKMHPPVFVSSAFKNITNHGIYQDGLVEMDWSVGTITQFLKERQIENSTLVIFISDNGPEIFRPGVGSALAAAVRGSAGTTVDEQGQRVRLRGHKTTHWEGGIRIPAIIKWTGRFPANHTVNVTTSLMDILPTVIDLLEIPYPEKKLDGRSLLPNIMDATRPSPHKFLFHHCDMGPPGAVTYGRFKIHFTTGPGQVSCSGRALDPPVLYDVVADPGESRPLRLDDYSGIISDVNQAVERHQLTLNSDGYDGVSQYDYMMWPWLFPCANFPFCHT